MHQLLSRYLFSSFFIFTCYLKNQFLLIKSCQHDIQNTPKIVHNVFIEPFHIMKKRSINQRLRIAIFYDNSIDALSIDTIHFVKKDLIPKAVNYWEDTLKVRHTPESIKLLRQCNTDRQRYEDGDNRPYCVDGCSKQTYCGDIQIPNQHLDQCRQIVNNEYNVSGENGAGITGADFVLYVSALATERCGIGTTVAFAAYCQLEGSFDRPVAGYVNLCPNSISTKIYDMHQMQATIKHEILHALGFSAGLFAFYRDENGIPLTRRSSATGKPAYNQTLKMYQWSDLVVKEINRYNWLVYDGVVTKKIFMVVLPTVLREVRNHFNCSELEGAELEDQGILGTALTHWEKRIFENEAMTATYTQNPIISRITLALMEDTGWYKVNFDKAEEFEWAKNMGCDFVMKSCMSWMKNKQLRQESVHPYCDKLKKGVLETECTDNRQAVALCNLIEYPEPLPPQYRYFDYVTNGDLEKLSNYGGSVSLADYCPYIQEFNWKKDKLIVRGTKCTLKENMPDVSINYLLESYGADSMCFQHRTSWTIQHCEVVHPVDHWGSGCYKFACTLDNRILIFIENKTLQCTHDGQLIKLSLSSQDWLHTGSIICPNITLTCENVKKIESRDRTDKMYVFDLTQSDVPCSSSIFSCTILLQFVFYSLYFIIVHFDQRILCLFL